MSWPIARCRRGAAALAAALLFAPLPVPAAAPRVAQAVALPNARYTIMPAQQAIKRFKLFSLLSPEGRADQDLVEGLEEAGKAIVFDGDVTLDEPVAIFSIAASKTRTPFGTALIDGARLIVVNGNLHCGNLSSDYLRGVFVLGNVDCDAIFLAVTPFYVKGNMHARRRLLASGDSTDAHGGEGVTNVRVDGTVFAPKIRTWYFRLGHLKFIKGAAKEFIVDGDPSSSGPCSGDKHC